MRIEISRPRKTDQKPDAPTLTPEEIQAREIEKAQLLEALSPRRERHVKASESEPVVKDVEPVHVVAEPVVLPSPPTAPAQDYAAATAERKAIEASIKEMERELKAAQFREKQAQQAAIVAQQQHTQAIGVEFLAPFKPRLDRHLAEVSRVQSAYGPTLKDFARSMASDPDPEVRKRISEVYRAAAPLGQKLGDARATIDSAIRGLMLAMQSAQAHVHEQAKALAEVALEINLLSLESECKSLVQLRNELRPGYQVHAVTADHIVPPSLDPRSHIVSADFGGPILG